MVFHILSIQLGLKRLSGMGFMPDNLHGGNVIICFLLIAWGGQVNNGI